jgi:hypothetical protein
MVAGVISIIAGWFEVTVDNEEDAVSLLKQRPNTSDSFRYRSWPSEPWPPFNRREKFLQRAKRDHQLCYYRV